MTPIEIPYFEQHAKRAHIAANMAGPRHAGVSGRMFANHIESTFERPAIRGVVVRYGEPFWHEGQLTAFVAGCFTDSLRNSDSVELLLEHNAANVLADTGLRFHDGPDELAFEYEPPRDQSGAVAVSLVASGSRTDVSVGARKLEASVRNIQGHDVRLVTTASIAEVSLCVDGKVGGAHARIVDLATASPLKDEVESGVLRFAGLANDLKTSVKRLSATVDGMGTRAAPKSYSAHHIWD